MTAKQTVTPVLIVKHVEKDVDHYIAQHAECGWVSPKGHGGPRAQERAEADFAEHAEIEHGRVPE